MKSASSEVRRARPLLGTFVEIAAEGAASDTLHRAISKAFGAIERVHRLMSFHDPQSDVGRLNRARTGQILRVHPWTYQVLRQARRFAAASGGCFDITIAPALVTRGFLPRERSGAQADHLGDYREVELLRENKVRIWGEGSMIDLGGIAKGFAVDKGIGALKKCGLARGLVNAGGDLRAFGSPAYPIEIRHPDFPRAPITRVPLREGAIATSAHYFAEKRWKGRTVNPIVDPQARVASAQFSSVSVRGNTCMCADGLTKIVMLRGESAFPLVRKFSAEAFLITNRGTILHTSGWQ